MLAGPGHSARCSSAVAAEIVDGKNHPGETAAVATRPRPEWERIVEATEREEAPT